MPASGSSSELSSHQMAIRSHPGVQKMPASGISSEVSAHQMAPAGAIAHSRAHLCSRASSLSFSSLVSPLRPLGSGLLGRGDPRYFIYFYAVTGQPSSSSLARRACVHVLPFSLVLQFFAVRRYVTGTRLLRVRLLGPDVRKRS